MNHSLKIFKYLLYIIMNMTAELLKILTKYPDYDIKGMLYEETFDWGYLYNIYVNHQKKCIELTFHYKF